MTGPRPENEKNFGDPGWRRTIQTCPKGHPYDEENTYVYKNNRKCRTCQRERMAERRAAKTGPGKANLVKTHCPHGHEYSPENTYVWTDKHGKEKRICRTCQKRNRWENNIPKQYGITHEIFLQMLESQNGACAICAEPFPEDTRPVIDHDHSCCSGAKSCGKCVRGLLCKWCNAGLGSFKDNPERLLKASAYLSK